MTNPRVEAMARLAAVQSAAEALATASGGVDPRALVILGSGLEGVIDGLAVEGSIAFGDVPGMPGPTVEGHAGRFVFGRAGDTPVLAMQGRVHLYEGHASHVVAMPVRAARLLGCETLVVTNAAGGVNPTLAPGDIVVLYDQLNLMCSSPLEGPNVDEFGPRFPVMAGAYTPRLVALAGAVAGELGIDVREGVYAGLRGPAFETPAEVAMLRVLGADVVGMSTVPEVIAAAHCGMQALGLSLVTNTAASLGHGHEDVLATSARQAPVLARLVAGILTRL